MTNRPTTLSLMTRHCPAALDHYEAGTPYDRRIFVPGTAAHDVLHGIGVGVPVERVVERLITTGREGVDSEPPLSPDAVFSGRDIALAYLERVGELGTDLAKYEVGCGWGPGWKPEPYSTATWLRSRLDVVDVVHGDDEDYPTQGLVARDYKSAWPTNAGWLDSIQAKVQALGLWDQWRRFTEEPPDFIRIEAANLRTGAKYNRDYWLDEPHDQDMVEGCRRDVELMVRAANHRPRIARPGVGCMGCPYVLSCEAAQAIAKTASETAKAGLSPAAAWACPETVATIYAISEATRDAWAALAREAANHTSIAVEGGEVGYRATTKAVASEDAATRIVDAWMPSTDAGTRSTVVGLLLAMKPGATSIRNVAKSLYPERMQKEEREAWTPLNEKTGKQFGVWPTKETT